MSLLLMFLFLQTTGAGNAHSDHRASRHRANSSSVPGTESGLPSVSDTHPVSSSRYAAIATQRPTRIKSHPTGCTST